MPDLIFSIRANRAHAEAERERVRRRVRGIAETLVLGGFLIVFVVIFGR